MVISSIYIFCLIQELRQNLLGKKITRILLSEDKKDVLFLTQDKKERNAFLFCSHPDFFRIEILDEKEIQSPDAYASLRKDFAPTNLFKQAEFSLIQKIEQMNFDRIVKIFCIKRTEEIELVLELTGRNSNLILKRFKDNVILNCLKKIDPQKSRYRQIEVGLKYKPPPPHKKKNPFELEKEGFFKLLKKEKENDILFFLINNFNGIDLNLAKTISFDSSIKFESKIKDLTSELKRFLWENFFKKIKEISNYKISPQIILDKNKNPISLSLFDLPFVPDQKKIRFSKLNLAIKKFFFLKIEKEKLKEQKKYLSTIIQKNISKLKKREKNLKKDLKEAENYELYKKFGGLLLFYKNQIKKGKEKIILKDIFEEGQREVEIKLNPILSPLRNAQAYFKKYKKLKGGLKIIKKRKEKTRKEVLILEKLLFDLNKKEKLSELEDIKNVFLKSGLIRKKEKIKKKKKKKTPYSPREFLTSDGLKVLVGKNNKENDYLTFHLAKSYDLWFHAQDVSGSHVILKKQNKDKSPSKSSITETAKIAAYFSRAKKSSKAPVIFTLIKYVKKPKGAKPGLVFVQKEKTIIVSPSLPLSPSPLVQRGPGGEDRK